MNQEEGKNTMTENGWNSVEPLHSQVPDSACTDGLRAMQLSGRKSWPPRDVDAAIEVIREAMAAGVNNIDTSDYTATVTNQISRRPFSPIPRTDDKPKPGARRGRTNQWIPSPMSRQELIDGAQ